MSVLSFFPWITMSPAAIGKFRLVPHRVGASLEVQPRLIDAILSPYQEPGGGAIESATLVQVDGRSLIGDLTADEEAEVFRLGDAVAFCALARRGLFEAGPYLSREHLALVVRRFTGSDPRAIQVVARRRDGRRWIAADPGTFRATRPPNAPRPPRCEVDPALASALLDGFASAEGASLQEAVAGFDAASGDGDGTSPERELVLLVTALERLVGARGAEELPANLSRLLDPFVAKARVPRRLATLQRLEAAVEPGRPPSVTIVEAWARDLERARLAPGDRRAKAYWSPEAHLLVGTHLFPAAVLARLAGAGLRPITETDRGTLLSASYLASLRDPFARRRSLAAHNPHLWRRALEVARRQLARIQLAEVLARSRGTGG